MKILLAQKLAYLPGFNGASRVSRCLLEKLAEQGHECRVIAPMGATVEELKKLACLRGHDNSALRILEVTSSHQVFSRGGVKVYAFENPARLHDHLKYQIQEFDPTWIVISEDPTYMLLATATEMDPQRTVFLSQSQATLPFGPDAFLTDRSKSRMLQEVAGILTSSEYLKLYIQRWGDLDSFVVSVPVYGLPPFPQLGAWDNPYLTMINPSNIKGLPIFLELARRFRETKFAAVPTWATNAADRTACAALPNVTVLHPSENIDEIFKQTRVLLVPSLWGEAFGLVVVEGMLRGIPVLASNLGGLIEAKLGVDYLLPVGRIGTYENRRDENGIPIPVIPKQNVDAWDTVLRTLLSDRAEFERLSAESRKAATEYVSGLSVTPTEQYLEKLSQQRAMVSCAPRSQKNDVSRILEGLPAKKLEALAAQLKKNAQQN